MVDFPHAKWSKVILYHFLSSVDQKCFVKFPTKITDFSDIEPKGRTTRIYIKYSFPNRSITL